MSNVFGSRQQQSSTTVQELDPDIKNAYLNNLSRAQGVAGGLGMRQFAPRSGDYMAGADVARQTALAGPGFGTVDTGANMALSSGMTPATSMVGNYMNPFTSYVAGNTLADLNRANQMALTNVASDATKARAFGGSRSGVAQAETNRAFLDTAGRTLGNLYAQGFDSAVGAAQSDLNRQLSAANVANTLGQTQQQLRFNAANNLTNLGLTDQQFAQEQLDARRNLPLEQQQIINAALGLNPAGGSGNTSNTTSSGRGGSGIMGLFG